MPATTQDYWRVKQFGVMSVFRPPSAGLNVAAQPAGLRTLLWVLPVPTTPPRIDRIEAAAGIALLDLCLRMNHIARITETLTYVDASYMDRDLSFDIETASLSVDQRSALSASFPVDGAHSGDTERGLWVPVARQARQDVGSLIVRGSDGSVLPRMTDVDIQRRVAAGLIQVFRMLAEAHPDAQQKGTALHALRTSNNRARWLIESAILQSVFVNRSIGSEAIQLASGYAQKSSPHDSGSELLDTDSLQIRGQAQAALEAVVGSISSEHPLLALIDLASESDMLVVMIPTSNVPHHVQYRAPRLPAIKLRRGAQHWLRKFIPQTAAFRGEFNTTIPRGIRSYHLNLITDDEVFVSRFVLSTDVDSQLLSEVVEECDALAAPSSEGNQSRLMSLRSASSTPGGAEPHKLLEQELQGMAARISDLSARRSEDFERYLNYHQACRSEFGLRSTPEYIPEVSSEKALSQLISGHLGLSDLFAFAGHYRADAYRRLANTPWGATDLVQLSTRLTDLELNRDITCDNDPSGHSGHIHWRPRHFSVRPRSFDPLRATASFTLSDEPPSLIESARRFYLAMLLLLSATGLALFDVKSFSSAIHSILVVDLPQVTSRGSTTLLNQDALATILLLVPGLLISRVGVPARSSLLRDMRAFQVLFSYIVIGATTLLAAIIAASAAPSVVIIGFLLTGLFLVLALVVNLAETQLRVKRRSERVMPLSSIPLWLRNQMGGISHRPNAPDGVFDATGDMHV